MDGVLAIGVVGIAWWAIGVAMHLGSIALAFVQPAIRRRAAVNSKQPPVTVVIPVKGLEPELEAAFEALYSQDYPNFEVIVSAASDFAPALDVARRAAARYPHVRTRYACEDIRVAVSPKLNNLVVPLRIAEHDLIFVKDSNARIEPGQLAEFVRHYTPGVGMVVAGSIAWAPQGFAAEIERAYMNGYATRLLLAASALGFGIGHGKIMLFDRRDFERAGGVASISWGLTEDHPLSLALARIGLRTVISAPIVRQVVGRRHMADVWNRQLRWMLSRWQAEPWSYYGELSFSGVLASAAGGIGAAALGLPGFLVAIATLALWVGFESVLVVRKGWGWSWQAIAATVVREFLYLALWARTWGTRKVFWGDLPIDVRRRPA